MPRRLVARVLLLAAFAAAVAVEVGGAATTDAGLTFNVTPNPIIAGEPVLAYGRLGGPEHGDKKIVLHDRVNPATSFSVEAITTTDTSGFYEFALPDGIVNTSRSWYVRAGPRPEQVRARTRCRRTHTRGKCSHRGHDPSLDVHRDDHSSRCPHRRAGVAPASDGVQRRQLEDDRQGAIDASSGYSVSHDFHTPGAYECASGRRRRGKHRSASSDLTVVVEQAEHPSFTIDASNPVIDAGQTVTISGVLRARARARQPLAGDSVTLWGHAHGAPYAPIASTTTAAMAAIASPRCRRTTAPTR